MSTNYSGPYNRVVQAVADIADGMDCKVKDTGNILADNLEAIADKGVSGLPAVTAADNGDVLTVVDGAWGKGSGGASSLADLSDVEINPISPSRGDLLRFDSNGIEGKWKNVSPVRAILANPDSNSNQGAVFIGDTEEFLSAPSAFFERDSQEAFLLSSIIESAIADGQDQTDNLPKEVFRRLISAAASAVFFNIPLYLAVGDVAQINASLSLDSATTDYATFVGTFFYNSKFYRITLIIYCPNTAGVATVLAKAEELMTFTEPT